MAEGAAQLGAGKPVLVLDALSVSFPTPAGTVAAVKEVSLTVAQGRKLGLIGESGSGKTTTALAVMRMLAAPGRVSGGSVTLGGTDLLAQDEEAVRRSRLKRVAYIPQGAMNSLNPVMRVERQLWDAITAHEGAQPQDALADRSRRALESVGLGAHVGQLYPHELSGGMKQRVCIAMGVLLGPELIIADEPTSALDVVTQRHVMQTLSTVQAQIGSGLILIGHDMGLMAQSVDDLAVLQNGVLVEHGPAAQMLTAPRHPYTRELISSVPVVGGPSFLAPSVGASAVQTKREAPLLAFDGVSKVYGEKAALHPLSFTLDGTVPQIVSIVGQSGSGKSTLGSLMLGFTEASHGAVRFEGKALSGLGPAARRDFRKNVQAVFQDPYACFNPFYRVDHALTLPYRIFGMAHAKSEIQAAMEQACRAVGLDPAAILRRYPHQLSGGQRQRLIVARALMLRPKLLIADEPVSMVDASLRAEILKTIYDLKDRHGISIFYITHDLATAYHVSDYVLVLYRGQVVEAGPPKAVIGDPQHPYTRLLIDSIPWPDLDRPWGTGRTPEEDAAMLDTLSQGTETVLRGRIDGFALADSAA